MGHGLVQGSSVRMDTLTCDLLSACTSRITVIMRHFDTVSVPSLIFRDSMAC